LSTCGYVRGTGIGEQLVNIDTKNKALVRSAGEGDKETVQRLIDDGADANARSYLALGRFGNKHDEVRNITEPG
jgi:hypothetical protein